MQRFDLVERQGADSVVPGLIQLILMDDSPSLHELQLLDGQVSRKQLSINAHRSFIFIEEDVKVRFVMLIIVIVKHFDNNAVKTA